MIETLLAYPIVHYGIAGAVGGILYGLVNKFGWDDRTEYARRIAMGIICGYLVLISGLPNSFTAFSMSYFGIDGIEAFLTKYKTKK